MVKQPSLEELSRSSPLRSSLFAACRCAAMKEAWRELADWFRAVPERASAHLWYRRPGDSLRIRKARGPDVHRRQFDVGLVPVAEILLHDQYDIVDGIAIAGRGAVKSVFLAHRVPIEKLKRVAVDPASRTSAWLVRVILKYGYHVEPEFYPLTGAPKLSDHEAMMLFGDGAIWYRHRNGDDCFAGFGRSVDGNDGTSVRVRGVGGAERHEERGAKSEERRAKSEGRRRRCRSW